MNIEVVDIPKAVRMGGRSSKYRPIYEALADLPVDKCLKLNPCPAGHNKGGSCSLLHSVKNKRRKGVLDARVFHLDGVAYILKVSEGQP